MAAAEAEFEVEVEGLGALCWREEGLLGVYRKQKFEWRKLIPLNLFHR